VFERLNLALAEDVGSGGIKSKLEPSTVIPHMFSFGSVAVLSELSMICSKKRTFKSN
jgi:hypothetical protein